MYKYGKPHFSHFLQILLPTFETNKKLVLLHIYKFTKRILILKSVLKRNKGTVAYAQIYLVF